jgi:hypothetical protein
VLSAFWHDDEFREGEEWQIFLKTEASQYPHLEAHLRVNHPGENPEITAVTIADGSAAGRGGRSSLRGAVARPRPGLGAPAGRDGAGRSLPSGMSGWNVGGS